MAVELLLGIGLAIIVALIVFLSRFEREARRQSEVLVGETEKMLAAFDVDVTADPAIRRRRRDGRNRRRRRKKGSGPD